jgi:hypothetical protein
MLCSDKTCNSCRRATPHLRAGHILSTNLDQRSVIHKSGALFISPTAQRRTRLGKLLAFDWFTRGDRWGAKLRFECLHVARHLAPRARKIEALTRHVTFEKATAPTYLICGTGILRRGTREPLRYNAITGLTDGQLTELTARLHPEVDGLTSTGGVPTRWACSGRWHWWSP